MAIKCRRCGRFNLHFPSFHFLVSFSLSGPTEASHLLLLLQPSGPTGKVPGVCGADVTSSLCQVVSSRGTCFHATKQKSRLCLLAKGNFQGPQETSYSLVCDSFILKCVHVNPGLRSVCLSPFKNKLPEYEVIPPLLHLIAQQFTSQVKTATYSSVLRKRMNQDMNNVKKMYFALSVLKVLSLSTNYLLLLSE